MQFHGIMLNYLFYMENLLQERFSRFSRLLARFFFKMRSKSWFRIKFNFNSKILLYFCYAACTRRNPVLSIWIFVWNKLSSTHTQSSNKWWGKSIGTIILLHLLFENYTAELICLNAYPKIMETTANIFHCVHLILWERENYSHLKYHCSIQITLDLIF